MASSSDEEVQDPQSVTSIYYVDDAENNVDDLENDADPLCAICDDGGRIVRFYGGARGRVSSFSCTNATINKFKNALGKHGAERCGLGPSKGLEESELMSLTSNKGSNFSYSLRSLLPGDFSFYSDFEGRTDVAMTSLH
ncbi:uncharacterized protein A4U43_C04F4940 [Asparagus officinalis]|uniref:Uncharacterized protein n=1 Tax=Asparagus officinalis TaxID=4686 RepID=A0A5P1EYW2_ASPOF|nr:uncharacterized protein A4U43_C04F4940 [Asparagus officinalis]